MERVPICLTRTGLIGVTDKSPRVRWALVLELPHLVLSLERAYHLWWHPADQCAQAKLGTCSSRPDVPPIPPGRGWQLGFFWPLKITCDSVWDVPWDVLGGVCLAEAQACCPAPTHQQHGWFLKFGAALFSQYHITLIWWSWGDGFVI